MRSLTLSHFVGGLVAVGLGSIVACGGGTTGGPVDGGTSGSSGTSGTSGTSSSTCTEFVIGGTVDDGIAPSATSRVYAQSVADAAAVSASSLEDLGGACRRIAKGLDASQSDLDAADAKAAGREQTTALCTLALAAIQSSKAKVAGTVQLAYTPPSADLSVAEKGQCQGKCAGSPCDPLANPSVCTGGSLFIECRGECSGVAGATVKCEPCASACQAACQGNACSGSCKAPADGSVLCDGKCSGSYTAMYCRGGKLEGGCRVDAKCDASCDVIVAAKSAPAKPILVVEIIGAADAAAAAKLKATLEAELPTILALRERYQALVRISGAIVGGVSASGDMKPACIVLVQTAASEAVSELTAGMQLTDSLVGSVN